MDSAESFITEYLQENERIAASSLRDFEQFRRKFYAADCVLGRLRGDRLAELCRERERVTLVSCSDRGTEVITTKVGANGAKVRLRYQLTPAGGSWLIRRIDLECAFCHGTPGERRCTTCRGEGWWPFLGERKGWPLADVEESRGTANFRPRSRRGRR